MPRLLLLVVLLALTACATGTDGGADRGAPSPAASEPTPTPGPSSAAPAGGEQAYVGLTEQEAVARAEAEGVPVRVVMRDGEGFPQTMDFRDDRVNLTVEGGRVTAARRG